MDDQSAEVRAVLMAEVVGFEPTDPFEPSVFKTAALSHAQPYFLIGVPPGTRTPTNSFGDCDAAITLGIHVGCGPRI